MSWHPRKRELIVARRAGNTTQLHRVERAGGALVPLTDFAEPVRFGSWWPKAPDVLVFARDSGGNEQMRSLELARLTGLFDGQDNPFAGTPDGFDFSLLADCDPFLG